MPTWKKNIFVRVVRTRMKQQWRSQEDNLTEYPVLTVEEKDELLAAL